MRHKKDIRRLNRNKGQRKALMRNMAISFFECKQVQTTEARAKQLRRITERLITLAKKDDLSSYRRINSFLNHPPSLRHIKELKEQYKDKPGGYTQIIKLNSRKGDNSRMTIIKLV